MFYPNYIPMNIPITSLWFPIWLFGFVMKIPGSTFLKKPGTLQLIVGKWSSLLGMSHSTYIYPLFTPKRN
jgi:hypothetical protein